MEIYIIIKVKSEFIFSKKIIIICFINGKIDPSRLW